VKAASFRSRHRTALATIGVAVVLDVVLGLLFSVSDHVPAWDGLYFSTVTATTVGYGDIIPHGWGPHVLAVLIMVTVIPLFGASFSLFTSGLSALRVHRAVRPVTEDAQAARKIAADLFEHVTGDAHELQPPAGV
jgi:hypothetical protein